MNRRDLVVMAGVHGEWLWPKTGGRLVVAPLDSAEAARAFVGRDGTFSPGECSFAVSAFYRRPGQPVRRPAWPADQEEEEVAWRFLDEGGRAPVSSITFEDGRFLITEKLVVVGTAETVSYHWRIRIENRGARTHEVTVYVAVRAFGPAGGPVRELAWDAENRTLVVNGSHRLLSAATPRAVGCLSYLDTGRDISGHILSGELPAEIAVADPLGLASCAMEFDVSVEGRSKVDLDFVADPAPVGITGRVSKDQVAARDFATAEERSRDGWELKLAGFNVALPDQRIEEALYASLHHVLAGVWDGEAHISPVSYPMRWLRDGVYMVEALLKSGHHALARGTLAGFLKEPWAGGAGPEADAPGQLLWALGRYHQYTRDTEFLAEAWPVVERQLYAIHKMRQVGGPLVVDGSPVSWPPEHGLICGRMDGAVQLVWVNAWTACGLLEASSIARVLGRDDVRRSARDEGERLLRVMTRRLVGPRAEAAGRSARMQTALLTAGFKLDDPWKTGVFDNPRDLACILWPCRAAGADVRGWALNYFEKKKLQADSFYIDPNWRYFDIAQAHAYLWAGLPELAWATVDAYLKSPDAPYAWAEVGGHDSDRARWDRLYTTERPDVALPHGWVAAEMFLLLRDMLFFEDGDRLVVLGGFHPDWRGSKKEVKVSAAPTPWGELAFTASADADGRLTGTIRIQEQPPGGMVVALPGGKTIPLPEGGGEFSVETAV